MKNNKGKKNRRSQTKYKLRRLGLVIFLAVIFVILILNIQKRAKIAKLASEGNLLVINGENIDISKIASTTEVNPPTVGARNDSYKVEWNKLGNNYSE